MPPKSSDSRMEAMERDPEELKLELQRLPSLERAMEHMSQNFMKLLQTLEETQKLVHNLTNAQTKEKTVFEGGETSS